MFLGSTFNSYCGCGGHEKKCSKKPTKEGNNNNNNDTTNNNNNNNETDGNNKDKEQNNKPLSKEDLEKQANEVNEVKDELGKIKEEIKKKIEGLKNLTESDILTKFNSIENKDFFEKCKKLLDIIKDSKYLDNKKPDCFYTFPNEYDCLIETHKQLSDTNYYNKYINVLKIYAYYFYILKDLHNLKSKIDEKVKILKEDIKNLEDKVFNDELDNTLKQINKNLSYYSFIHENSLDKIIANAQKEVDENNGKIEKIKQKLTTALSSVEAGLKNKKTDTEKKIEKINNDIEKINKIIEENENIIGTKVGASSIGNHENYKNINKKITEILNKITNTGQFIYIDSYKDNAAVINKFNSLKTEIINYIKSDIKFCKSEINWNIKQIEEYKNKEGFDKKWYYNKISEYRKKIDESNNKINEFETKLFNKINEEINKKNIEKESQVVFYIGIDGKIEEQIFDKKENNEYDLKKISYFLSKLKSLFILVNIHFLSNYSAYHFNYFNYSPEREENENEDNYKKRVEDIKNKVKLYFDKLKIDYKELDQDKSNFDTLITKLKTDSEKALKDIENFFIKKGENEYYKEFDEKRKIYIEIIEGLGTQYYALKGFYDNKFNEFTIENASVANDINNATKKIFDNQYKLVEKRIELEKENMILTDINNSLDKLDDCSKNIIIEDTTTGEKNVNSSFSSIYYLSTDNHFKYDDDHYISFISYNNNIAILKSLNANKEKIEKAVADRNEKVKSAKKVRDEKKNIIYQYNSVNIFNSDIESPFSKIAENINKGFSYEEDKIKMYFEKTILIGIKGAINKKNNTCSSLCTGKNCYKDLRDFLTNSKLEETYNSIVTEWNNAIKDSISYPSSSKGF